jgi:flagellar assembly protein FliH
MTQAHQKFDFGTVFADNGLIVSAPPPREQKSFSRAEVEAIADKARTEGEASALAVSQLKQAQAVEILAQATHEGLTRIEATLNEYKALCVELSLVCARKIAAEALDHFPQSVLSAALNALDQEIGSAARLVITLPDDNPALKNAAQTACDRAGFSGSLVFREQQGLTQGAFDIHWHDGRADFDPERVAQTLAQVLRSALKAQTEPGPTDPIKE